jgi:hypothetical protein
MNQLVQELMVIQFQLLNIVSPPMEKFTYLLKLAAIGEKEPELLVEPKPPMILRIATY